MALLVAVIAGPSAAAGAWPLPQGEVSAISTLSVHSASDGFGDAGEALPADFAKTEVSVYLEYGLTNAWTLVARPAWQDVVIDGEGAQGWATTEVALRRALWVDQGWAVSAQVAAFAPGSAENRADSRLGEGGRAIEARGLLGRGWGGPAPGFIDVQAAQRWSADEFGDEARLDVAFGFGPVRDWSFLAQSFSLRREGSIAARPFESDRIALSAINDLGAGWRVQVGALSTLDGRNAIDEKAVFAALWLRY